MWICPIYRHKFINRNQAHSCGDYSVEMFLEGKTPIATGLFHYFLDEYGKIGPYELHPVKTRVALLTKMRFASVNRVGKNYIDVHFVLTEPYDHNGCFFRVDNLENRFFIHHMKIRERSDLTPEIRKYMRLAYDTGNRSHVKTGK